ncbi:hypothetical protein FHW83_001429 [Duganella sp. SG902]|nr:hypothetical protein [Duganella sp. SG902]
MKPKLFTRHQAVPDANGHVRRNANCPAIHYHHSCLHGSG